MATTDVLQAGHVKEATARKTRKKFEFPTAVTTLALVTVGVWFAALLIPAGAYEHDDDGAPIPGTYHRVPSPLGAGEKFQQLMKAPVNGLYGLRTDTGFVDTEAVGTMFGSVGVVLFILAIGAFISVSFATRSLEVAVAGLAARLRDKGGLLIAAVMVLFSLLGTTMGFSVETLGFYSLFIPLMAALGYDRMVTSVMIIVGALVGVTASTVNPFATGVAAGEAGISIGDGIGLRVLLWVLLTGIAVAYLLRYAARIRRDPSASVVGFEIDRAEGGASEDPGAPPASAAASHERLTGTQKWVLAITAAAFALMIFSVIPWSSILGAATGPADYYHSHETSAQPYWFELSWWFPELSILFVIASVVVGVTARMREGEIVKLISRGAADMIGPAMVIMLAAGVSVIMNNTQTLDTILNSVEQLVRGTSAGVFAIINIVVNLPLSFIIPSSSGHAVLAMPLLSPLSDFAGVSRAVTITAFQLGHGLMLMASPTAVVVVGGLAVAKVGYDKYLRFVLPMLLVMFVVSAVVLGVAAALR
jgi:uncharacterized ion transporter superfamily protein YfcC